VGATWRLSRSVWVDVSEVMIGKARSSRHNVISMLKQQPDASTDHAVFYLPQVECGLSWSLE
jgi:hypothetical protein